MKERRESRGKRERASLGEREVGKRERGDKGGITEGFCSLVRVYENSNRRAFVDTHGSVIPPHAQMNLMERDNMRGRRRGETV